MKADIIKEGKKVGEISFVEGSISILCNDEQLKDRIYLHLTSPEPKQEEEIKKLDAAKGAEPGTLDYFKATLEFIDEMEKDFEFVFIG